MSEPLFHWFLPTSGDGREAVDSARSGMSARRSRGTEIGYLQQVAQAADYLGFEGALTPVGTFCEEPWILTAALARETRSLKYLVAMRPSSMSPTFAAQMAATFQNVSGGRLALNIVAGGDETDMKRFGDRLDKDTRYAQTAEFITVLRGAWNPDGCTFKGHHYDVEDARVLEPPDPVPPIYFGGASPAAEEVAARHADVYLAWGEPPEMLAERVDRMRALAERQERTLRFGVRMHVITRDTADEAWAEADRMLDGMSEESIKLAQRRLTRMNSVGQQRLNGGSKDNLLVSPNLWAGISLIRGYGSTALVGSHEEVAERIRELQQIGFEEFIFGGLPHLEEAYKFAEGVMPLFEAEAEAEADFDFEAELVARAGALLA